MNSKVLNGSQRVVMDGVISDDECQELQRLTNVSITPKSSSWVHGSLLPLVVTSHQTLPRLTSSCLLGPLGSSNFRRWLPRSDLSTHPK